MVVVMVVLVVVGVVVVLLRTTLSGDGGRRPGAQSADSLPAAPSSPTSDTPLTADDVRFVAFTKPKIGGRGYDEDEVDEFLDRAEVELRALDSERDALTTAAASSNPVARAMSRTPLTDTDVYRVRFNKPVLGKRGYHAPDVDQFLDLLGAELGRRQTELQELQRRGATPSTALGEPAAAPFARADADQGDETAPGPELAEPAVPAAPGAPTVPVVTAAPATPAVAAAAPGVPAAPQADADRLRDRAQEAVDRLGRRPDMGGSG